ncbi:RICIN domain-containing protein [Actinomadura litoris]|uniref:RICIN domain-containing protein n=1 Tax=Actinomadura litoris TaxID=2678616 RepID=UPI001565AE9A|nr:RICIN domain-containing protein [Actinomadura litoris]
MHLWEWRNFSPETYVWNQRWSRELMGHSASGNPVYRFINAHSGKCLDKSEDSPNGNGNLVYQFECNYHFNQLWEAIPSGDYGYWQLKNFAGGRCLDIEGPREDNGTTIHVWDCYSIDGKPAPNQVWNITATVPGR